MDDKDFNDYDMKLSEWRGYVVRALEDTSKESENIRKQLKDIEDCIDKLNGRLTGVQVKLAGISATVTIVVSIVMSLIL